MDHEITITFTADEETANGMFDRIADLIHDDTSISDQSCGMKSERSGNP